MIIFILYDMLTFLARFIRGRKLDLEVVERYHEIFGDDCTIEVGVIESWYDTYAIYSTNGKKNPTLSFTCHWGTPGVRVCRGGQDLLTTTAYK